MARVEHHDKFFEIDGRIRIEAGLPFVVTTATKEALANDVTHPDYQVGAPDARGNIIEHGKEFAYIDFLAPEQHEAGLRPEPHAWKVYRLEDDPTNIERKWKLGGSKKSGENDVLVEDTEHPHHKKRWIKHGEFNSLAEAETFAKTL